MKSVRTLTRLPIFVAVLVFVLLPAFVWASGQSEGAAKAKPKVTFYWALYDGLTEDYRASLQDAFMKANPDIQLDIVPISWEQIHDKITTSLAGGQPPELSVIGTRWLLEFMGLNAIAEPAKYVSQATMDNIVPGAKEAVVNGKLMGLPIAAGARFMAVNKNLATDIPQTMEQLEKDAIAANSPDHAGLIMPGKKHTELTDFAYYFYAAGGDFFAKNADGSFGKSTVNSEAGIKALTFMNQLANVDKVVQPGFLGQNRMQSHPVFYAGKAAYVMIGAWVESSMKQAGSNFPVQYFQIPGFQGNPSTPLIITDSIAFFSGAKNLPAAGKFIDFFYKADWKGKFDQLVGFPPVTKDAAALPAFQTPLYKVMGEAALHSKGWPLIDGWDEDSNTIWDAVSKVLLGQATPKAALDEAAAAIDKSRGM